MVVINDGPNGDQPKQPSQAAMRVMQARLDAVYLHINNFLSNALARNVGFSTEEIASGLVRVVVTMIATFAGKPQDQELRQKIFDDLSELFDRYCGTQHEGPIILTGNDFIGRDDTKMEPGKFDPPAEG